MTKQNAINYAPAWIPVTVFQNSWSNYGNGLVDAGYCLNSVGQVQFRGVVRNGATGTLFFLPVGYRPKDYKGFRVFSSDLQAYILIYPAGDVSVTLPTNSNTYLYLDNILFPVY